MKCLLRCETYVKREGTGPLHVRRLERAEIGVAAYVEPEQFSINKRMVLNQQVL